MKDGYIKKAGIMPSRIFESARAVINLPEDTRADASLLAYEEYRRNKSEELKDPEYTSHRIAEDLGKTTLGGREIVIMFEDIMDVREFTICENGINRQFNTSVVCVKDDIVYSPRHEDGKPIKLEDYKKAVMELNPGRELNWFEHLWI
ncbi:hypothetical protein [Lysinibacillus xylanilyticus]|uniref:hypothetical protein n=1 Tax=Lysinibacillus xylanilyticus TaxID=582475 RepID=UPI0036D7832B